MKLSREDVCRIFDDVLERRMTRDAADRWAFEMLQLREVGSLMFVPAADTEVIWGGIMFLYGVDLGESPGRYLHTDSDIRDAMLTLQTNGTPPMAA
ncbi:hypothetical protein [Rhizobium sp. AAP43]|uniref:hypothetical protein n=1 Tax=Rhizobium sp. AAP43 TaxID=1523420 RepID=UPI0006B98F68|nr:hypothetical protein [Rhizobium sp. AAP43]KPF42279.1 hypothetical protein IP76_17895 [Rhizobium sp. AAP43]